jgi:putative spermidine/putrescine transport system ATP-binding protein
MNVRAASQAVRIDRVSVGYRGIGAVRDVSLDLPAGEILALLGPSGCGKTTLLRSVAGFVPHSGDVYIGERRVTNVPSHRRNIGMVFQDYALFPHMTVAQNVSFGLRMRGHERATIGPQVSEALKLVGLEGFNARMASQLSGGQQQRVALARALVIKPTVLLLDEPLSALDKKLREEMRSELKRIQRLTGVTTIFVTHDQDEALALADRLALMYQGTLLQFGEPEEVYRRPVSSFVAEFLGAANSRDAICREVTGDFILLEIAGVGMLKASRQAVQFFSGQKVTLFVRPEQIGVRPRAVAGTARTLPAVVAGRTYLGRHFELSLRLDDGTPWIAHVGGDATHLSLDIGTEVALEIDPVDAIVFGSIERNRV